MSMTKLYVELEQDYGTELVRRAMAFVSELPGDDLLLPRDRYDKVARWLKGYRGGTLEESLAEVEAQLASDCGAHRDLLVRVRDRLRGALAK
jgi:hypothetical protein